MTAEFAPIPRHLVTKLYAGLNRLRDQYPDALDALGEQLLVDVGVFLQVYAAADRMRWLTIERGGCGRVSTDEKVPWAQVCVEPAGHPADEHSYIDVDVLGVPSVHSVRVEPPTAADRRFNECADAPRVQVARIDGKPMIWAEQVVEATQGRKLEWVEQ